ncbi:hypothetical protein JXM83_01515 [Candidatus Woesearchaeota archaeon]|nr:hypothetical protein [Candidatus Woesearchaeota archaeon]
MTKIIEDFTQSLKEQNSSKNCVYCGNSITNEYSDFTDNFHYINFTCTSCNKENRYKVDFISSGINKKIKTKPLRENLEKIISKSSGL